MFSYDCCVFLLILYDTPLVFSCVLYNPAYTSLPHSKMHSNGSSLFYVPVHAPLHNQPVLPAQITTDY